MSATELIDVVDANDHVITRATRADVRHQNLRHRAVYIFVFNPSGQLFVHQRTATKDVWPGYWDPAVGGVVVAGEQYDPAARRELLEELGIASAPLKRIFPLRYEDEHTRVFGMVYSCTWEGPVTLQVSEIARGEWLDLDVVLERIQRERFCADSVEAFRLYLARLAAVQDQ